MAVRWDLSCGGALAGSWLCSQVFPIRLQNAHGLRLPHRASPLNPSTAPALDKTPSARAELTDSTPTLGTRPATTAVQGDSCSSKAVPRAWCSARPACAAPGGEPPGPSAQPTARAWGPPQPAASALPGSEVSLSGSRRHRSSCPQTWAPFGLVLSCLFYLQNKPAVCTPLALGVVTHRGSLSTLLAHTPALEGQEARRRGLRDIRTGKSGPEGDGCRLYRARRQGTWQASTCQGAANRAQITTPGAQPWARHITHRLKGL